MPARRLRGLAVALAFVMLLAAAEPALARWRSIGEGGCGDFADAVSTALDGDVITPMYEPEFGRNTNATLIDKGLEIEGGWDVGTGSCAATNLYASREAMLDAGFLYNPANHSGLTGFGEPVLLLGAGVKRFAIRNLDVMQNDLASGSGGGMRLQSGSLSGANVSMDNVTFKPNYFSSDVGANGHGGALALTIDGGSTLSISNTQFLDHRAGLSGGGFYLVVRGDSAVTIAGATVQGNRATSCAGGRIIIHSGTVTISGSSFSNNLAGAAASDLCVERAAGSTGEARLFLRGNSFSGPGALQITGAVTVYDERVSLPLILR